MNEKNNAILKTIKKLPKMILFFFDILSTRFFFVAAAFDFLRLVAIVKIRS